MTKLLAGLDIGTTGCKISVFEPNGRYLGRIYRQYPLIRTAETHEVNPIQIRQAVFETLSEAARKYPGIAGIGITSFGESFVLMDEDDEPLQNVILYTDPRGEEECALLCEAVGREKLTAITGLNPHPTYSIPKLMWVQRHQPAIFEKARRICLMGDFMVYLLTGNPQIDYSLASRTMAFDIRHLTWSQDVLRAADIPASLFSNPVPTGTPTGRIKPTLAAELGLSADTLILPCGHDHVAASVGSGIFDDGTAVNSAGTVECITPVFSGIPESDRMVRGNYAIVPYAEKGKYVCYAYSFTSGALVDWFISTFAGDLLSEAAQKGGSVYQLLEGPALPENPTGLLILPHFAGAATPYMDMESKGAIVGLDLSVTRQKLYLGILEGICYEMLVNMRQLHAAGVTVSKLRATGGGTNSKCWLQMKADIFGIPVTSLNTSEAGCLGSAIMAGTALNLYPDLRVASAEMVSEKDTFYPRDTLHRLYAEVFAKYERLYDASKKVLM